MKESLMLLAKGNVSEYHELMAMSVEDFLIRFKVYVGEIENAQQIKAKQQLKVK